MRVLTAVQKNIVNQVTIENQSDLASHPYCLILDLKEPYPESSKKLPRRTRIVNVYDNKLGEGYPWQRLTTRVRRVIEDMSWTSIIRGRVLIVGDVNAHSTMWNPHCRQSKNAAFLEELIESFELVVNNDTDFLTCLLSQGISIIYLALTSPELGVLRFWEIPEEYLSWSDHELILMEWEGVENSTLGPDKQQLTMTGWSTKNLLEDKELLQTAKEGWNTATERHTHLDPLCTKKDFDKEVEWFIRKLSDFLNNHTKITQITSYSK